jgi:hypothetical protein
MANVAARGHVGRGVADHAPQARVASTCWAPAGAQRNGDCQCRRGTQRDVPADGQGSLWRAQVVDVRAICGGTRTPEARVHSATRRGWSEGIGECDDFLKFCLSSSGWKSRPTKVDPHRSEASLAPSTATWSAMRRHASARAVGIWPRKWLIRDAQEPVYSEGHGGGSAMGQDTSHLAGCNTAARAARTTQEPGRPRPFREQNPVPRRPGHHSPTRRASAARTHGRPSPYGLREEQARSLGVPRRQGTTIAGEGRRSGSRRAAYEQRRWGTASRPDPAERRRPVLEVNFRREPCPRHRPRTACPRNFRG